MTPLRQRMMEDMTLAGLNEGTKKEYIRVVSSFARQFVRLNHGITCLEAGGFYEIDRIHLINHGFRFSIGCDGARASQDNFGRQGTRGVRSTVHKTG